MDEQKLIRIQDFLTLHNQDINTITKVRLKQLSLVDDVIQQKISRKVEAKDILRSSIINITNVSSETKISRKTFYNNELLKLFVESYAESTDEKTNLETDFENLKEKYDLLNNQIKNLLFRDIDIENLRQENTRLVGEIKNLQNHNAALENRLEKLMDELSTSRRNLAENNLKIIDFTTKK